MTKKTAAPAPPTPFPEPPRQPIGHVIKSWCREFQDVIDGMRDFEVRRDDRDYQPGDTAVLVEFDNERGEFTGRVTTREIRSVFRGKPFPEGHCAFNFGYLGQQVAGTAEVVRRDVYKR